MYYYIETQDMITAKKYLEDLQVIKKGWNEVRLKHSELVILLENYHNLKMAEAGFKKDSPNKEDTIKT